MARAYSLDLRERVVEGRMAAGQSCPVGSQDTFMVSVASVVKWSQRQRVVGSPAALKMGGHRPYLVARERDWSSGADRREAGSHAASSSLRSSADRGPGGELLCALAFLQHEGAFKKKAFAPQNRTARTSPSGVSGGRRVRRRSIRGGLSSSTRPGRKPT